MLAAVGCGAVSDERVTFADARGPIGKWQFSVDASDEPARDAGAPQDGGSLEEASAVTSLAFEVTTKPIGGKYQPKNVGAIWVADASGKLVKTLEVWAATRVRYLSAYNKTRAGMSVDATSRATLPNHRVHRVTWDLTDRSGAPVPKGEYTLSLELTDADAAGKTTSIDFDTGGSASTRMPPDSACFTEMRLELK